MASRVDLTGEMPVLEYRSSLDRYFITYPSRNLELIMSFELETTAFEVARNSYYGVPFFTMIPTVPLGTPYPRPWLQMPRLRPGPAIELIVS